MKKICFVIPTHHSFQQGGAQYQVQLIIDELLKIKSEEYEIHYITQRASKNTATHYKLHILNGKLSKKYGQFLNILSLFSLLIKIKPDIVYQRIAGAYTGICAYYCKRYKVKMVFHIAHEIDVNVPQQRKYIKLNRIDSFIQNYGIKHATVIIAQTANQKLLLKQFFNREATVTLYNFHLSPSIKPLYIRERKLRICWVANFKPFKQPELFIELSKCFSNNSEIEFIMIGKLMGSKHYQQQFIDSFHTLSSISYLGEIKHHDVNKELEKCHLLVNTSIAEGFSNTFIQAWMRGVPVYSLNSNPDFLFDRYPILGTCFNNNFEALKEALSQFTGISETTFEEIQSLATNLFDISNCHKIIQLFDCTVNQRKLVF